MSKTIKVPELQMANGKAPAAPAGALVIDENDHDALMGAQLTAQWEVVKGGMKQQLLFGAMMMKVREHLVSSARGRNSATRGPTAKGEGLEAWLKEHAPKVSKGSAYRMMEVAEGIRDDLKIGKTVDLEELLATALEDLPEKLARKREQIDKVIEGKSQRQLLLEFGKSETGPKGNGGNNHPKCPHCDGNLKSKKQNPCPHCKKDTTAEPEPDSPQQAAIDIWTPTMKALRVDGLKLKNWADLPDHGEVSRDSLEGLLIDLGKLLRDARPVEKGVRK